LLNASGAAAVPQQNKIGKEKKIKLPTDGLTNAIQTVRPTDLGTSPIPEAIFSRRSSGVVLVVVEQGMASIAAKAVKCERQMPLSSGADTAASVKGATIFNRGKKPFIFIYSFPIWL